LARPHKIVITAGIKTDRDQKPNRHAAESFEAKTQTGNHGRNAKHHTQNGIHYNSGMVARGRFELPSAGLSKEWKVLCFLTPEPAMLDRYIRRKELFSSTGLVSGLLKRRFFLLINLF